MRILILVMVSAAAACAANTTIAQPVRDPHGNPVSGTVSWKLNYPCTTPEGQYIGAQITTTSFTGGNFSIDLAPNDSCVPAKTTYAVTWRLSDGTVRNEIWSVPTSSLPVLIKDVVVAAGVTPSYIVQATQLHATVAAGDYCMHVDSLGAMSLTAECPGGGSGRSMTWNGQSMTWNGQSMTWNGGGMTWN